MDTVQILDLTYSAVGARVASNAELATLKGFPLAPTRLMNRCAAFHYSENGVPRIDHAKHVGEYG